jgi:predicted DNA binding CopG/RHH family protein
MKKKLPKFKSDREAARFLERADLSDYIVAENMVPVRFEFERKSENLTMRVPAGLLKAVKTRAAKQRCPTSASSARRSNAPWLSRSG